MGKSQWPKRWQRYLKHRRSTPADWKASRSVERSRRPRGVAQYDPSRYGRGLDDAVETLEVSCVEDGIMINETKNIRRFYLEMDHIVGACSGELTPYVYAQWEIDGSIHGRPISPTELKDKFGIQV